jgi:hypothetical protein
MKNQGSDFIIHGLFVDDVMRLPTRDKLRDDFFPLYERDFEITGGANIPEHGSRTTRQNDKIAVHLDTYIQEVMAEYKEYIKKAVQSTSPKAFLAPGIVINHEDCSTVPDDGMIGASRKLLIISS